MRSAPTLEASQPFRLLFGTRRRGSGEFASLEHRNRPLKTRKLSPELIDVPRICRRIECDPRQLPPPLLQFCDFASRTLRSTLSSPLCLEDLSREASAPNQQVKPDCGQSPVVPAVIRNERHPQVNGHAQVHRALEPFGFASDLQIEPVRPVVH